MRDRVKNKWQIKSRLNGVLLFDSNKSTKGASKLRRDLINAEIANLRDLIPLPPSTRQRLSQLQLMALVCVYVRKANYFQQVFQRYDVGTHNSTTHNIGFSKALSGFLMMMTQNGKLLYISDNAAEYLGHSMEDLLIHGDSVYDIIDKQDHQMIQAELGHSALAQTQSNPGILPGQERVSSPNSGHRPGSIAEGERKMFLCRMNVSRNARRQMRFGDQKIVLVQGHFLSFLSLCSRNEPVFLATCSPVAMPETRECVVHGATNVFTTIHTMDMKVLHVDKNGEFYLGFTRSELQGASWYQLLHWEIAREAQSKHRLITQSEQDRSCILLLRMQRRTGDWLWVHCVLQVKDGADSAQQPVIVCTNQVLSDREAAVLRLNGWLYSFYSVQNKLQYELSYDVQKSGGSQHSGSAYASTAYYPGHMSIPAQHQLTPGMHI
ncbi:neuronal PAS domain-containing protein 4-like [Ctenocephalides felis]|uniref:neuronal PAS domain-containing protein 4-like n=1 Tax=Ctenocephalides felis TaxID=7515 RepID=UPI000E6E10B5|nr:neuronal PAS domain-containing protein 4-like [Ctenocephalides felis]